MSGNGDEGMWQTRELGQADQQVSVVVKDAGSSDTIAELSLSPLSS